MNQKRNTNRATKTFQQAMLESLGPYIAGSTPAERENVEKWVRAALYGESLPEGIPINLSPADRFIGKLFRGSFEISESVERLRFLEVYFRQFPSHLTRIWRSRFLSFLIEGYFHEVYILQQRLLSFLTILKRLYKTARNYKEIVQIADSLNQIILTALGDIVHTRGHHVHEHRFSDQELERLRLLEVVTVGGRNSRLLLAFDLSIESTRIHWKEKIHTNNMEIAKLLDAYFSSLFEEMFDEEKRLKYPNEEIRKSAKVQP